MDEIDRRTLRVFRKRNGLLAARYGLAGLSLIAAAAFAREDDAKISEIALQSELRYQEGLQFQRRRDMAAALAAFEDASRSGHGQAARKLGDLYGTGSPSVERDYQVSLQWYQRARNRGIEPTKKPFVYSGMRR